MRIIGGQFKGFRLKSFQAPHIRPTTDRVKESLFNILSSHLYTSGLSRNLSPDFSLEGFRVLDLFSGTGSLGLEALSRGATHATFVDSHPQSMRILKSNLRALPLPPDQWSCLSLDVFSLLKSYTSLPNSNVRSQNRFDLIFIDPPFTLQLAHQMLESLSRASGLWHPSTVISIESQSRERLDPSYPPLFLWNERRFGDKKLSFFSPKTLNESGDPPPSSTSHGDSPS